MINRFARTIDERLDLLAQWIALASARAESHRKRVLTLVSNFAELQTAWYAHSVDAEAAAARLAELEAEQRAVGLLLLDLNTEAA